jgi:hypothetical protein
MTREDQYVRCVHGDWLIADRPANVDWIETSRPAES